MSATNLQIFNAVKAYGRQIRLSIILQRNVLQRKMNNANDKRLDEREIGEGKKEQAADIDHKKLTQ